MSMLISAVTLGLFFVALYFFARNTYRGVMQLVAKGIVGYAVIALLVFAPYLLSTLTFDVDALSQISPYSTSFGQWVFIMYIIVWSFFGAFAGSGIFDPAKKDKLNNNESKAV